MNRSTSTGSELWGEGTDSSEALEEDGAFAVRWADIRTLFGVSIWPFLLLAALALGAAAIYLRNVTPSYAIVSEIVVERKQLAAATDEAGESVRFNATQAEILKSQRILDAALSQAPLPADLQVAAQEANATGAMWVSEHLTVSPIAGTQVISIAYTTPQPQHGVALLQAVVDQYLELTRGSDLAAHEKTLALLLDSEVNLRDKLTSLQARYREDRSPDSAAGGGQNAPGLHRRLAEDFNKERLDTTQRISTLEDRRAALARALANGELLSSPEEFAGGGTADAVAKAKVALAGLLANYHESHPDVATARSVLTDLEARLRAEATEQADNLRVQLRTARRDAARLNAEYEGAVASARNVDIERMTRDTIRAEIDSTKALLDEASTRINDRTLAIGSLAGGRAGTVASIIRAPQIPLEAVWPRPRLIYALALLLAGGLALFIGLMRLAGARRARRVSRAYAVAGPNASQIMREAARRRVS